MLRIGCVILTVWSAMNLIASVVIFVNTLFLGGHTPALYSVLTADEVGSLSSGTLATLDSIAVFANGTNIAFCLVTLPAIWLGLFRRQVWSFWGLLVGFAAALLAGVAADYAVGTVAPEINIVSGMILCAGFAFAAFGLFRNQESAGAVE